MAIATSNRKYLSQAELAEFAAITITDSTEADDQISQAEELIDAYVGFHQQALTSEVRGKATAGTSTTFTLQTKHQNVYEADYFIYCWVEIIGGTGVGQKRSIASSTKAGVVTVDDAFATTPDSTSIYRIYQLGKFPRYYEDTFYNSEETPSKWYKYIPEEVTRATAAQVQFIVEKGADYFAGDAPDFQSESLDDYSYTKGKVDIKKFVSPKARQLLRGYINRIGQFV